MNTVQTNNTASFEETDLVSGTTASSPYGPFRYGDGEVASMTDVITPGYLSLRAKGHIVNNDLTQDSCKIQWPLAPYAVTRRKTELATGNLVSPSASYRVSDGLSIDSLGGGSAPFLLDKNPTERANLLSGLPQPSMATLGQVLIAALAKASTDCLALVSIVEAKKTVASLEKASHAFQRIASYSKKLRPKDFTPQGALRHVGNGLKVWLEVRYGLLPTYYDLLGYSELVRNVGGKTRVRFVSTVSGSAPVPEVLTQTQDEYFTYLKSVTRQYSIQRSAGCLVEPSALDIDTIHSLGIDRLVSTAWELIPFSFIVDWFLNTGKLFAAHEGRFGQRVLASWTVERHYLSTSHSLGTFGRDTTQSGFRYQGSGSRNYAGFETYKRTVRVANPEIPLLPTFQLKLNWKKALDLVALASTVGNGLSQLRL